MRTTSNHSGCARRPRAARTNSLIAAATLLTAGLLAACGPAPSTAQPGNASPPPAAGGESSSSSTPEINPVGDIPDNQAYVPFASPNGLFTVLVPEGWARSSAGGATTFTDKLNSVRIEAAPRADRPSPSTAQASESPTLASSVPGYAPGRISSVDRSAGPVVLITYGAVSAPNAVVPRSVNDAVERYEFWRAGQQVTITVSGPVGADNVDPWRKITDSLRWQR